MREISGSLDGVLKRDSGLRLRLSQILQVCASISVAEDFLVINLGTPAEVTGQGNEEATSWARRTGQIRGLNVRDNLNAPYYPGELGQQMVNDFRRVLGELDGYKRELRQVIARTAAEGT